MTFKYNVLSNTIEHDGKPLVTLNRLGVSSIVSILNSQEEKIEELSEKDQ